MTSKRQKNHSRATSVAWMVRSASFVLPLIVAGAYLNMGQSSCGGGGYFCQGQQATHVFNGGTHVATEGDDVIVLAVGTSPGTVFAGGGDDLVCVISHAANDAITVYGGDGLDELYGGDAGEQLYGEAGNDIVSGGAGNDVLRGDDGFDFVLGGTGNDVVYGGEDDDYLWGDEGDDRLYGWLGHDGLYGGAGNDLLVGDDGNDTLYGDDGDDSLNGDDGNDALRGGTGADTLQGDSGNDDLRGGLGADELHGGAGDDTLWAGDDNTLLTGGPGLDVGYLCGSSQITEYIESLSWDDPNCPVEAEQILSVRLEVATCELPVPYGQIGNLPNRVPDVSLDGEEWLPAELFGGSIPPGETGRYDIYYPGTVNDIRQLAIYISTFFPACVSRVSLGVNHFSSGPSTLLFDTGPVEIWVPVNTGNVDDAITFSFANLRGQADWRQENVRPVIQDVLTDGFSYDLLEQFLDIILNRVIQSQGTFWWKNSVSLEPGSDSSKALGHLSLGYDIPLNQQDQIDIDFVIGVGCEQDELTLEALSFVVSLSGGAFSNILGEIELSAEQFSEALGVKLTETVMLPDGQRCVADGGIVEPKFDACGLWLTTGNNPNLSSCTP